MVARDLVAPVPSARRGAVLLLALLGLVAAHLVDPSVVDNGPILCPFRALTGIPCPGCGMTRAFVALAHGQWAAAMGFHPLSPLVAVLLSYAVLQYVLHGRTPHFPEHLVIGALALTVVVWLVRTAPLVLAALSLL